jgi:2,4-dichlorophenol 6-monooxygenase
MLDTDVLVVGTGPTGGTCALALADYGIRTLAITRHRWLADGPRAHITNQRALEVLRDLDVEAEAARVGTPWDQMREMVFAESLAGDEVARLRVWGAGIDRNSAYRMGSPCPLLDIPQPMLEPILVSNAAARGADIRFSTSYVTHEQDADGVITVVEDGPSGDRHEVRSRYLVGADGAHSQVLADAGLDVDGVMGRAGTVYARFRADLTRFVAHRPGILHRILLPAVGEIGLTTLRAVRPWTEWIAGWGYDVEGPAPCSTPRPSGAVSTRSSAIRRWTSSSST